ncbi:hypothetical protein VTI74DRAFT_8517 [Chaetomium olivicolor]
MPAMNGRCCVRVCNGIHGAHSSPALSGLSRPPGSPTFRGVRSKTITVWMAVCVLVGRRADTVDRRHGLPISEAIQGPPLTP